MPLVPGAEPAQLGGIAHLPETPETTPAAPSSALDVAAAAERQSNVLSSFYDRLTTPLPSAKPQPGFDAATSIPHGYEGYADRFMDAESPEDIAWVKQRIDSELNDRETLSRAGKGGFVASMAAGMTDPVTLASMAIPGGGETRLAQAARLAVVNAGTSAAQEMLMHELSVTRSPEESAFNIAGSAVLGGVLGAAIRPRIPARTAESLGNRLSEELHNEGAGEKVLGPTQRTVLDTPLPSDLPESVASHPAEGGEGYTVGEGELTDEQRKQFEALSARSGSGPESPSAGRTAAGGEPATGWREETRIRGAGAADVLPVFRGGQREVGPEHFGEEALGAKTGHPSSGLGVFFTTSEEEASRWGRVSQAHLDIRNPKIIPADELPGFDSAAEARAFSHDLEAKGFDGIVIKNKPFGGHDWVVAFHPEQVVHEAEAVTGADHINPGTESTTGAAAVARPGMQGESIARGARTIAEGPIGRVAPGLRVLTSDSLEARRLVQELANTPEMLEKNRAGIATPQPIERKLWKYEGVWWQGLKARAEAFRTYRERLAGTSESPLSRREFGREVSYAMRRGDEHEIPEVAQAARETRRIVFDPLKVRAQKLGLLPEEVKAEGADSYLTRQYDARAIRQDLGRWLDTVTEGFKAQGVDPAEARDIAHKVTRNVLGSERGTMDWRVMDEIVPESGRLKERSLKLPDTLLEPWLTSDIDHLSHSYLRSMAPEVEFTERFGTRDMKDQIDSVKDEYARLMEQAKARGEDVAPVEKQMRDVLRDLSAIRDRLYGIYGAPKDPGSLAVRAGRLLRADNALRLLGAATLAHFPDLANVIARYGMPKTFGAIGKVLTSMDAMKLAGAEAKRMGAALDMAMNLTASVLGDYGSHSQFAEQRAMAKLTRAFTIATGETPLITAVQALTSTLAQDEILRAAGKVAGGQALSANATAKLAAAGLDEAMLKRIAAESAQHSREVNGLHFGMSDGWKDQRVAEAFESAVLREAHGVTLRPGAGDTPLFMSTELGKLILQFKTFAFAASRIVVNPLLQGLGRGDLNAVQGLFALAFMGAASYAAKQKAAGQPAELENPGRLAMEVLDKSNLLGWTGEFIFPGLWQFGMKDLSRWSDRDASETLLGPSAGTVATAYERRLPSKLTADTESGEKGFSRSDLHFLRRLMPGQNLWYFRRGVNALEDAVGDSFDLPGTSNKERADKVANE